MRLPIRSGTQAPAHGSFPALCVLFRNPTAEMEAQRATLEPRSTVNPPEAASHPTRLYVPVMGWLTTLAGTYSAVRKAPEIVQRGLRSDAISGPPPPLNSARAARTGRASRPREAPAADAAPGARASRPNDRRGLAPGAAGTVEIGSSALAPGANRSPEAPPPKRAAGAEPGGESDALAHREPARTHAYGAPAQPFDGDPNRMNQRPSRSRPSSSKTSTEMKLNHIAWSLQPASCGTAIE